MNRDELEAEARNHQAWLDRNTKFFTIADLSTRWGCSSRTVRSIDRVALPYMNVGQGLQRQARRYHPDAVFAYEAALSQRKAG